MFNKEYKVIIFDLFFTLIEPEYSRNFNEFTILGISQTEWENHAEKNSLYKTRILNNQKNLKKL